MIHFKIDSKPQKKFFPHQFTFVITATKTCEYHGKYETIIIMQGRGR